MANYITTVYKHTVKLLYTINNDMVSGESIIDFTLYWLLVFYRRSWLHDIIAMPHTGTLALGFML